MTRMLGKKNRELLALGFAALGAACSQAETSVEASAQSGAGGASASITSTGGAGARSASSGSGRSSDADASLERAEAAASQAGVGASASSGRGGSSVVGSVASAQAGAGGSSVVGSFGSAQAGAGGSSVVGSVASAQAGAGASSQGGAGAVGAIAGAGGQFAGGQGGASAGAPPAGEGSAGQGAAAKPSTWRIAFLGDSITETSCTSQLVHAALLAEGHDNIDLVGTKQNQQGCGVDDPDRDVEGHSGYLVTNIVGDGPNAAELPMWCAADRADLVLMHFGTNDAWNSGIPIMDIVSALSDVLSALRAVQPRVIVFVAQIIPLSPDNCADCERRVRELNEQIPVWAAAESTAESPVYVVDQWTGFDSSTHAYDRVHPNMMGAERMSGVWLEALRARKIF